MKTFLEDIGYPSGANAVAEPSDLGQVKGAKKQKSPNGVARVKNKIDTKPTIENKKVLVNENKFVEKKDSHAVIGFGRFNPPHAGHQVLIDKIRSHAALVGGKPHVFISHSEGTKKNPLPYHKKIKLMKKAFGDVVHETEAKNPYDVAKELNGKFDHLTLVAGEDRIKGYKEMLKAGEGKDFNFKSVNFKSIPRDDLSATKMRQWALEGNHKDFEASLPDGLKSKSHKIMKQVKKGLLKEDLQEDFKTALNSFSYRSGRKGGDYDAESGPYHKEKAVEFGNNKVYKASEFPHNEVSDKGFVHHAAIARAARDKDSNLSTSHEPGFITHGGKFMRYDKFDSLVHQHMLNNGPPTNGQKIDISNGVSKPQSDLAKFHNQKEEISESAIVSLLKKYLERTENIIPDKDLKALEEKAENSGVELSSLKEVYESAVDEWYTKQEQTFLTTEQWAFNRVNSYIHENIKVHKLECEPCNKHYESRWPKQQCPTCHTKLKVIGTYEQGSSHPVIKEESFNHHSSACTKCNKIYNNFSCAFKCKHPLIRIGLCDKCKNLKEDHGAGFVGTDKLVKKYAKVTTGQEKIKAMYNKYIEDKFVKESVSSDPYQGGDLFNDLDKPSSPFHREKALKNFKTGKIHKESEFDPEKIKGENDIVTYHSMMAQEAAKKDKISNFRRQDFGRHYERGYIGHHGKYMADNEMEKFSNNHVLTHGYPEPHEKIRPDRHYSALSKFHEEQLPQVKGRQMYKAFLRDGWEHKRTVGSHRVMSKAGRGNFILCHGDNEEIHSPMVHKIVKQSGLNPARLREAHEPDAEKEARRTRILKRYAAKGTGSDRRRQMDAMKAFEGWGECEHHCPEHGVWSHEIPPDTACHNPAFHPCEKCIAFEPEKGSEFAHLKIDLTSRKK